MNSPFIFSSSALRASLAIGIMALGASVPAQAVVYDFDYQVWGNSSIPLVHAAGSQVFVEVTEDFSTSANDVLFKFTNTIPHSTSKIVNIFFDTGVYTDMFAGMSIWEQSTGVLLTMPGNLLTMSIMNSFDTTFTEDYTVGRGAGYPADMSINGINPGEYLILKASLGTGKSFSDVINAMNIGIDDNQAIAQTGLRISEIVHEIWGVPADDDHGAFVTANVIAVPEADAWVMMLAGIGLIGFMARRRII